MKKSREETQPEKINYKIPTKGSLGLFAAGDKGLRAWRKVRNQQEKAKKE